MDCSEVMDVAALLTRVKGKLDRLRRLAELYFVLYQEQVEDIGRAIDSQDSSALEKSAHKYKSSALSFDARLACSLSKQLECMGREGRLDGASEVYHQLQEEAHRLKRGLEQLIQHPDQWGLGAP